MKIRPGVLVHTHTFNPSTQDVSEFEASLINRMKSGVGGYKKESIKFRHRNQSVL